MFVYRSLAGRCRGSAPIDNWIRPSRPDTLVRRDAVPVAVPASAALRLLGLVARRRVPFASGRERVHAGVAQTLGNPVAFAEGRTRSPSRTDGAEVRPCLPDQVTLLQRSM